MNSDSSSEPVHSMRAELMDSLRRVHDWMVSSLGADGRLVCRDHRVEHTGKNAGAIVMALRLARHADREEREPLVRLALQQGQRLVDNLVREGTSPCFTFRPGRHDPFNCSNSVIDGGAAADVLGALVRELEGECRAEELDPFREACLTHARTYLRYAVLDKGIPAQRAWGLTGLASAWRLEADPVLENAALEAVELLAGIQHADGSYPYHPLEWGASHPGASDISAYYQSRVTAFLIRALEDLGRDPGAPEYRQQVRGSLDFLCALQGVDGIKVGLVEAKPWYWGANYEVVSHPFDIYALAAGWRLFADERYAEGALRALRSWEAHLDRDGCPRSHLPLPGRGRSYQCAHFWAGHAMWIARALDDLQSIPAPALERRAVSVGIDLSLEYFEQASLIRLEDEQVVAWVRGSRPGVNVSHGSPHGAGLLRVQRKSDGRELLARCRLGGHQVAEWSGKSGGISWQRGWRAGGREVRFSTWLSRVHWRAGRFTEALSAPLKTFKRGVLAFAHPRVSSGFCLAPEIQLIEAGVIMNGSLAWRDGASVPGSQVERLFRVDGGGLLVTERLIEPADVRGLDYPVPERASEIERNGLEIRYRLA